MTVTEFLANQDWWTRWDHHPWAGLANTAIVVAAVLLTFWARRR